MMSLRPPASSHSEPELCSEQQHYYPNYPSNSLCILDASVPNFVSTEDEDVLNLDDSNAPVDLNALDTINLDFPLNCDLVAAHHMAQPELNVSCSVLAAPANALLALQQEQHQIGGAQVDITSTSHQPPFRFSSPWTSSASFVNHPAMDNRHEAKAKNANNHQKELLELRPLGTHENRAMKTEMQTASVESDYAMLASRSMRQYCRREEQRHKEKRCRYDNSSVEVAGNLITRLQQPIQHAELAPSSCKHGYDNKMHFDANHVDNMTSKWGYGDSSCYASARMPFGSESELEESHEVVDDKFIDSLIRSTSNPVLKAPIGPNMLPPMLPSNTPTLMQLESRFRLKAASNTTKKSNSNNNNGVNRSGNKMSGLDKKRATSSSGNGKKGTPQFRWRRRKRRSKAQYPEMSRFLLPIDNGDEIQHLGRTLECQLCGLRGKRCHLTLHFKAKHADVIDLEASRHQRSQFMAKTVISEPNEKKETGNKARIREDSKRISTKQLGMETSFGAIK